MGYFLAVSAFQNCTVEQLAEAIRQNAADFGVACEVCDAGPAEPSPLTDATIFGPTGGWTLVLWPEYFNIHDFPTCQALSERLVTLVSTVHVYDSDYWAHGLFEQGQLLDRFCSRPDYFAEDSEAAARLRVRWQGNPEVVASRFRVPVDAVRGYLVQLSLSEADGAQPRSLLSFLRRKKPSMPERKVHPNDEFGLESFWVFTDFWRRLGIRYPDDLSAWAKLLRLGSDFTDRLPCLDES